MAEDVVARTAKSGPQKLKSRVGRPTSGNPTEGSGTGDFALASSPTFLY